jgi:hypothetical protein
MFVPVILLTLYRNKDDPFGKRQYTLNAYRSRLSANEKLSGKETLFQELIVLTFPFVKALLPTGTPEGNAVSTEKFTLAVSKAPLELFK